MSVRPRFLRVARMMLRFATILALPSMSACVLPIAPEFQDPPSPLNGAPVFQFEDPPIGSVVTKPSFTVVVTDPNVTDDLYYRWIADFPPFTENTRTLLPVTKLQHSADGTPLSQDLTIQPDCINDNLAKLASHQVMLVVADRPFLPAQSMPGQPVDFARVPAGAGVRVGVWTLNMECK
jgi:hypothetical protein